jgi:hypothetical protein
MSMFANSHVPAVVNTEESAPSRELPQPQRGARERELLQVSFYISVVRTFAITFFDDAYIFNWVYVGC